MSIRLKLFVPIVAAHLLVHAFARAENDASPYLSQREAGIAQREKMVLQRIVPNPASVKFRKVRYFEHYSILGGRRLLTAIVVCGQLRTAAQKGEPYRRFLSWVFIDLETRHYDMNKYVVAINDPTRTLTCMHSTTSMSVATQKMVFRLKAGSASRSISEKSPLCGPAQVHVRRHPD